MINFGKSIFPNINFLLIFVFAIDFLGEIGYNLDIFSERILKS